MAPAGIKIAAVARQLGVSRSWASREANAPGTRNLLAELLEPHRKRLNELFDQTLDVIEDAMKARKFLVVHRVLIDAGRDHFAWLEAVKTFTALMCLQASGVAPRHEMVVVAARRQIGVASFPNPGAQFQIKGRRLDEPRTQPLAPQRRRQPRQ